MKTKNILFGSFLADEVRAYIGYKRALGRKFRPEEYALHLFDRFLVSHNINDLSALNSSFIDSFLVSRPRSKPRSFNHLLGVTRCFFDWLVTQEKIERSPVVAKPRRTTSQYRPFLFKPEEVRRLLELAARLPDNPRGPHRGVIYTVMFAIMYGLGLRVGEVTRLCFKDVDMERQVLLIRDTKFGKNRLVPFGPRIKERLTEYMNQRVPWHGAWNQDDPLFSFGRHGERLLRTETVCMTFHSILPQLGLTVPPGVDSPRLHCLRHSFAVQTLLRWYRSGVNPGQRLPHLSTFMGHVSIFSTAWYLTITDELLAEANQRFENAATDIFREIQP